MEYVVAIIFIIIVGCLIASFIENRNGAGNFVNEEEEATTTVIGFMLSLFFGFLIGGTAKNLYAFFIVLFIGNFIVFPYFKYLARMSELKQFNKISAIKEYKNKVYNDQDELLDKIDNMTGQDFEKFLIEKLLPLDDFTNINGTKYSGDYGVDIIAEKNGLKCAIQCKRFEAKVNPKAIQEVVAGRKHYKCDKAIVITNNYYTNNAKQLADDNKVELFDRDYIIRLVKKYIPTQNDKMEYDNINQEEEYLKRLEEYKAKKLERQNAIKKSEKKTAGGLGFFGCVAAILVGLIDYSEKSNKRRK